MEHDPPLLSKIQPLAPAALDHVVRTCLAKDPETRRQTAQDVLLELRWIAEGSANASMPAPGRHKNQSPLAWAIASVVAVIAVVLALLHFREKPAETRAVRFSVLPPEKATFGESLAISPDGTRLALIVSSPGKERSLWVRRLDSLSMQPLAGTEGAYDPFWSPDGQFIAFFAHGKLKKIDPGGGSPLTLCEACGGNRGTWNWNGVILFGLNDVLYRISAEGGRAIAATSLDRARFKTGHLLPHFLPDGRHFLYLHVFDQREKDGIYVGALDSKETKRLMDSHWMSAYGPAADGRDGYMLFVREGNLMAQRFDLNRLELTGKPTPIVEGVTFSDDAYFSVSANGTLAYRPVDTNLTQLTWFDRTGKQLGTLGLTGQDHHPTVSPDGKRVAVMRHSGNIGNSSTSSNIWVLDLTRGSASRITFSSAADESPVWSPDGSRIAFMSNRDGPYNLYQKASNGTGEEELLLKTDGDKWTTDWSSDGRFLFYHTLMGNRDIWALPLQGDRKPIPILQTQFNEAKARLSPDGQWMVYYSQESGRGELYVRPFGWDSGEGLKESAEKVQISTQGGLAARWRRDGKELFYNTPGGKIMAVAVKTGVSKGRPTFEAGVPKLLFDSRGVNWDYFASTPDGQRFLVNVPVEQEKARFVTVILNWDTLMKR